MDLHSLAEANKEIFWDIPQDKLEKLSKEVIIERIINYGDMLAFKELVNIVNHGDLKEVFNTQTQKHRQNYRPKALNFLKNYLEFN